MTHKTFSLTALIITFFLMGCPKDGIIPPDSSCRDIEIVNTISNSNAGRSFVIQEATLDGKKLTINTAYNCGCGESEFFLETSADFMESLPVQTNVSLILKGNDGCEALCHASLCFNLSNLIDEYKATYPGDNGPLHINLDDFDQVISLDI